MTFALVTARHFERHGRKFLRKHPDLRPVLRDTLHQLSQNPFEPRLKLHALAGKLSGIRAVSLTHSYQLTLILKITEEEILLLDIARTTRSIGEDQSPC